MSQETEWFEEHAEEPQQRSTVLPALLWLFIMACIGWLFHYIAGHA